MLAPLSNPDLRIEVEAIAYLGAYRGQLQLGRDEPQMFDRARRRRRRS
ncbi:hypothetical protein [Phytohabitans maris]